MSNDANEESKILRAIIGGPTKEFFDNVFQNQCKVFRSIGGSIAASTTEDDSWEEERVQDSLLKEIVEKGWHVVRKILLTARSDSQQKKSEGTISPIIFRDQYSLPSDEIESLYGDNLFAAYLDGCSVVLNHSDWICPYIASLCLDLQQSFPHVFANAYLTPPKSQAAPPHADDRDVLVLQVVGRKQWKVYQNIPIPYPYPHEQLGKEGRDIPREVLDGPCVVDTVLEPGDVLYMPRGFIHEARTDPTQPSFHVTLALATHDWTLTGMVSTATEHTLSRIMDCRKAVPVSFGLYDSPSQIPTADRELVDQQLENILERMRQVLTVEAIHGNMRHRIEQHNRRSYLPRMTRIHDARFPKDSPTTKVVGPEAAKSVQWTTVVRAATPEEKALLPPVERKLGLHVREATADCILQVLQRLKSELSLQCQVSELLSLLPEDVDKSLVCPLTLLSFAQCCVELGGVAVVP